MDPTGSIIINFPTKRVLLLLLEVSLMVSSEKLTDMSPDRRKCLFESESPLNGVNFYTKNMCKMECRIRAALSKCKCIPFFYVIGTIPNL